MLHYHIIDVVNLDPGEVVLADPGAVLHNASRRELSHLLGYLDRRFLKVQKAVAILSGQL
jgi:hypothetical protein